MNNNAVPVAIHPIDPILASSRGALIVSTLRVRQGRFELTRKRLTYFRYPGWSTALGLLGLLLQKYMTGTRSLELELANVATIVRGAYGRNKRVMNIQMVDGQVHRVMLDKFDEMSAQLDQAMGGRGLALAA